MLTVKKNKKGSSYLGVYKCKKTNKYFFKNYRKSKCYKSIFFKKELDAAKRYDSFVLKNNPKATKLNFPKKKVIKAVKTVKISLIKKKDIPKRPRIFEYVKIIVYSRQDDLCTLCNDHLGVGRIIDHIIPRSMGGLDNINNYQAICGTCNKWKTYSFDHYLKNYLQNNSKNIILDNILKIQKNEYVKFNGPYLVV